MAIKRMTQYGFSWPLTASRSGREFLSAVAWLTVPFRQSEATGVGHIPLAATASSRSFERSGS